ncbi:MULTISPECIES: helix-turn-helix transcriptional regulator [unclassified Paenibacillus]|uniref:helix-turn-helix domain-containing protein n=2 Tax=unclassified Paenibacillus TaxID=185978 RepID=UPI002406417E|nr:MULTISPECIES: helix-turn-helix transcriptional regulator [unclassified Paenibacillus]MDF9845555.1 transcriptional regulator with XRE-family HTH domain [Paenibacillus sp. PastF-2]MDF9858642.1 transcriptional regulator with XRE-family HTH domain [Paenibacillus sp. PastF-1]MDH6483964.1 transcriptional regulator with XRE-family HTH domain [Paenibacillus sp. PastH-2]
MIEMIGLQFIADTFHMEYKSVAEAIGVSKQTFQDWIKERRKIPEPRLEQLSELFGIEDQTLFQKELLPSEKSEILMIYLTKTDEHEEIEITNVDDEGNEYTTTQHYSQHFNLLEYVQAGQKREKLTEQISALLSADLISESANLNLLADVVSVLQEQNRNKKTALELVLYYLVHRDNEWGVHPDYAKYEQKQFFEKLDKLLEETGIKP